MKTRRFLAVFVATVLLATLSPSAGASPLSSPCAPGTGYDPACDVNHDNQITITDIQLTAGHWNQTGTWIGDNNHDHLGQIWNGTNNSLTVIGSYADAALALSNETGAGLTVYDAGRDGVSVVNASHCGVRVSAATQSGVYIVAAGGEGVFIGDAGGAGVAISAAAGDGFYARRAGNPSGYYSSSGSDGFAVEGAQGKGLFVGVSDEEGVHVYRSGDDGVLVTRAGAPLTHYDSPSVNGFEVAGAEGNGFYVGQADADGMVIRYAGDDGIQIGEAAVYPTYGMYVPPPGTPGSTLLPNTANAAGQWALYTLDNIDAGNVFLSAQTLVSVVGGSQSLSPGDVVAALGLADPIPGSHNRLAQVGLANPEQANVVGVVSSRMAMQPLPGKEGEQVMHSTDGPAQPGDYVAITVLGAAQVKVRDGEAIQPGQRLAAGEGGTVRALQNRTVEGMVVAEGAPVIGVALEIPDEDGMVWVLVNPQ